MKRRWRWDDRWQGRLNAVSIVCLRGIEIPSFLEIVDVEDSSMNSGSSLREGWRESSLLPLVPCELSLLSPSLSSSMEKVSKFSQRVSSFLTAGLTKRSKITSSATSAILILAEIDSVVVTSWRPVSH